MTQDDANEIARVQQLNKAIVTSDGSVYKDADQSTIKKHCEDNGLEMFLVGYEVAESEDKPSKGKK